MKNKIMMELTYKTDFIKQKQLFLCYIKQEKKLSHNTYRSYNSDLNQFLHFWDVLEKNEEEPLFMPYVLQHYACSLSQQNIERHSIARKISCFNSLKKFLSRGNIKLHVPIKRPSVQLKDPVTISINEIFHLLDLVELENLPTCRPLRDKAIVELLYATGIRCAEIVKIEFGSIDFNNKSIIIRDKNKRERTVLFGNQAKERLLAYIQSERPQAKSSFERLFLNHRHEPLSVRSIQRICVMFRLCMKDKFNLTPHILRHSFAVHMINNGADIDTLQELLGHKARISTERYLQKIKK
jgi:integrase/recombinase XerC